MDLEKCKACLRKWACSGIYALTITAVTGGAVVPRADAYKSCTHYAVCAPQHEREELPHIELSLYPGLRLSTNIAGISTGTASMPLQGGTSTSSGFGSGLYPLS